MSSKVSREVKGLEPWDALIYHTVWIKLARQSIICMIVRFNVKSCRHYSISSYTYQKNDKNNLNSALFG